MVAYEAARRDLVSRIANVPDDDLELPDPERDDVLDLFAEDPVSWLAPPWLGVALGAATALSVLCSLAGLVVVVAHPLVDGDGYQTGRDVAGVAIDASFYVPSLIAALPLGAAAARARTSLRWAEVGDLVCVVPLFGVNCMAYPLTLPLGIWLLVRARRFRSGQSGSQTS